MGFPQLGGWVNISVQALDFDTCDFWADVHPLYSESASIKSFASCHFDKDFGKSL